MSIRPRALTLMDLLYLIHTISQCVNVNAPVWIKGEKRQLIPNHESERRSSQNENRNSKPDCETVSSPISLTEQGQYTPNHPKFQPATCKIVSASDKRVKALNNSSLSIAFCGLPLIHRSSGSASEQKHKRHIFAYICERVSVIQTRIILFALSNYLSIIFYINLFNL